MPSSQVTGMLAARAASTASHRGMTAMRTPGDAPPAVHTAGPAVHRCGHTEPTDKPSRTLLDDVHQLLHLVEDGAPLLHLVADLLDRMDDRRVVAATEL